MKPLFCFIAALCFALCSTAMAEEHKTADFHVAKGMQCQTCHATPDTMPETDTCVSCHAKDTILQKTKDVQPTNPHQSPHYGQDLDCVNCHVGHSPSINYCGQCHDFNFQVK